MYPQCLNGRFEQIENSPNMQNGFECYFPFNTSGHQLGKIRYVYYTVLTGISLKLSRLKVGFLSKLYVDLFIISAECLESHIENFLLNDFYTMHCLCIVFMGIRR